MSVQDDLLNDEKYVLNQSLNEVPESTQMCSFWQDETEDMCSSWKDDACGVRGIDNKGVKLNNVKTIVRKSYDKRNEGNRLGCHDGNLYAELGKRNGNLSNGVSDL